MRIFCLMRCGENPALLSCLLCGFINFHKGESSMQYTRFEELPVWNRAIELAVEIYKLTSRSEFRSRYSLRDQLERTAVSISNNIAEGFERGTTQELLSFIYIARGSAGEVRSMLCLLERLSIFTDLKSE